MNVNPFAHQRQEVNRAIRRELTDARTQSGPVADEFSALPAGFVNATTGSAAEFGHLDVTGLENAGGGSGFLLR